MLCGIRELWGPVNILVLDEHSFPYHTAKICCSLTITRFYLDKKSLVLQQAVGSLLSPVLFPTSQLLADNNSDNYADNNSSEVAIPDLLTLF